jgi:cleavage stimulation factor subunit 1
LVKLGTKYEPQSSHNSTAAAATEGAAANRGATDENNLDTSFSKRFGANDLESDSCAGLDFDYESDKIPTTADASQYETCYVTSHKAPCRAAAFDRLGTVIATGSVDASIKILDIERMLAKSSLTHDAISTIDQTSQQQSAENHPVIRTLYDHADEITTLAFHPYEPILVRFVRTWPYLTLF